MSPIALAAGSAIFLGLYDLAKKRSLDHNAVWPVLFSCTLSSAMLMLAPLSLSALSPRLAISWGLWIPPLRVEDHLRLALKAGIVSLSWACTYQALKHLPMSVAAPIRASAPLFTLLAATLFFHESPSALQGLGIAVTLVSYWVFALAGRGQGISLHRDKWVGLMLLGTLFGAGSGIYDKYLFQSIKLSPNCVQAWFSFYMLLIQGAWLLAFWVPSKPTRPTFVWRWSIILVGLFLVLADQLYFRALANPDALISIVSVIRRSSVVISFALGVYILKEPQKPGKYIGVIGILLGLVLISL